MMEILLSLYILIVYLSFTVHGSTPNMPTLVIVDGFSEYLSGHCKSYCEENDIRVIEVVSPYICNIFKAQGKEVPESLQAPVQDDDIITWAVNHGLIHENGEVIASNMEINPNIFVLSESDSGVSTAEKIASVLNLPGNGVSPHLRNKYQSNERAKTMGIGVVKQKLVSDISEAISFVNELWMDCSVEEQKCVVKPYRGVASDGVFLCCNTQEVKTAFKKLYNMPRYGGGRNDAVLIQEYADGPEFAVDTISQDGNTKIVALWKYHKLEANGAPFVYQCSELISSEGKMEQEICNYCLEILKAQDLKWGPTHTEIKYTKNGPRLIEINARWHAQHFPPIVNACIGYDAVTTTLDSFFFPGKFENIPITPGGLTGSGRILHLISYFEGKVKAINHVDEIERLESTLLVNIEPDIGDTVVKTVDIRTDCGYVLQYHLDPNIVERDYETIKGFQSDLFEIEKSEKVNGNITTESISTPTLITNEEGSDDEEEQTDDDDNEEEETEETKESNNINSSIPVDTKVSNSESLEQKEEEENITIAVDSTISNTSSTFQPSLPQQPPPDQLKYESIEKEEFLREQQYHIPQYSQYQQSLYPPETQSRRRLSINLSLFKQISTYIPRNQYMKSKIKDLLMTISPMVKRFIVAMTITTVITYLSANLLILVLPELFREFIIP